MDSLIDELLELVPDVIGVEPFLSTDSHGEVTYGELVEYPARFIGRTKIAQDSDGQERVSNIQAVILGAYSVSPQDRFTVPERFSLDPNSTDIRMRQPAAISIDRETDENGAHHSTVYFWTGRLRGY